VLVLLLVSVASTIGRLGQFLKWWQRKEESSAAKILLLRMYRPFQWNGQLVFQYFWHHPDPGCVKHESLSVLDFRPSCTRVSPFLEPDLCHFNELGRRLQQFCRVQFRCRRLKTGSDFLVVDIVFEHCCVAVVYDMRCLFWEPLPLDCTALHIEEASDRWRSGGPIFMFSNLQRIVIEWAKSTKDLVTCEWIFSTPYICIFITPVSTVHKLIFGTCSTAPDVGFMTCMYPYMPPTFYRIPYLIFRTCIQTSYISVFRTSNPYFTHTH